MKNKAVISVIYIILGALIILAPTVICPVCSEEKKMSCMYTCKAAVGLGILLVVLGIVSFFLAEQVRAGISIAVTGIGILVIATPSVLGVCGGSMVNCHLATKPLLIVLGILTALVAVVNTAYLLNKGNNE